MTIEMEMDKVLEETKELKVAIKTDNVDKIVEELADCFVALENLKSLLQLKYKFSNGELSKMKEYKKERTARRLSEGYYEKY